MVDLSIAMLGYQRVPLWQETSIGPLVLHPQIIQDPSRKLSRIGRYIGRRHMQGPDARIFGGVLQRQVDGTWGSNMDVDPS